MCAVSFDSVSKAIELARTLKPDDAMRVRANDVKVAAAALFTQSFFLCTFLVNCSAHSSIYSPHNQLSLLHILASQPTFTPPFSRLTINFRALSSGARWRACSVRLKAVIWSSCALQQPWTKIRPCGYFPSIAHFVMSAQLPILRLRRYRQFNAFRCPPRRTRKAKLKS